MWTNRVRYDTSTPFLISTSRARTASLVTPRSVISHSSSFFTGFFLVLTEIDWRTQNSSLQAVGFKEIRVVTAFKPHGPSGNFGFREATFALRELPESLEQVMLSHMCTWPARGLAQGPGGNLGNECVNSLVLMGPVFSKDREHARMGQEGICESRAIYETWDNSNYNHPLY